MKIAAIMCLVLGVVAASQAMYIPEKASNEVDARVDWKKLLKPILDKVKTLGVAAVKKLLQDKGIPPSIIDMVLGGIGKRSIDEILDDLPQPTEEEMYGFDWKAILKPILDKVKTLGIAAVKKLLQDKGIPPSIIDLVLGGIGKRQAEQQTLVGQILSRILEKYIAIFKDLVDQGKTKYQQVLEKAQALAAELSENATGAIEKVKKFIQDTIKSLLPSGPGYAVDDEMVALMATMDLEIDSELESYGILQNIKDTIKNIVDKFSGQFSDLRDFLLNVVKDTQNQLRPHVDNIKDLAKEFVENANKASDKVKQEAKKFFEQHKQDLGDLWQKVKDAVKDVQGNKREVAFEGPSTLVGQILERLLEKYIAIFKDLVDQGKTKYTQILEKAKALLEELNENATGAIEKVKQFIQNTLKNLLPQGPGYAMDDEMVAVMVAMDDEYQTILGKILSNMLQKYIQKLKDLVAHGKNKYQEILDKAQQLAGELEGHSSGILDKVKQFLEIVKGVISGNAGDEVDYDLAVEYGIIDSIRDTIRGIINHLKGKFNDLKNFFLQTLKDTHGQLKPHLDNIKDLAKDFIDHATAATDGVKDQALKFFNQYKNDLGLLWKQVQDAAKHVHGQITGF